MDHPFSSLRLPIFLLVAGVLLFLLVLSRPVAAGPTSDEYIRGYAAATLQRDFQITADSLKVKNGVIYLHGLEASDVIHDRIKTSLAVIEGVQKVVVTREGDVAAQVKPPEFTPEVNVFLPRDLLFNSLLADPRWPHFSVSYQHHQNNDRLENIGSANFGETFSIYRFGGPWGSLMEVGLHAGVFSIFDLAAESRDLVNADYFVAFPLSLKKNNFSAMARIFHQSSHLGDEFLLSDRTQQRINLSYEGFDTLLSYHFPLGFRLYGGGGYLFDRDPSDLKPWIAQSGLEFKSHTAWWNGALRPIAALDIQSREESEWRADVSLRAGVQFENPDFLSRKLKLMFEYYKGRSPNGQFYIRDVEEYFGIGLHFFL
ncbi:MAG: hypothetical protein VR65_07250 [Desulfobulbaceae bacterium BRH_c16a]|nr:MAG: hypothetical protein VR65_07250 [Desulfobulbaceae bacterium BRH_c16a]